MCRLRIVLPVVSVLAVVLALVASSGSAASTPASVKTPRWVLHVQRFSGGISNGVRAQAPDATTVRSARLKGQAAGAGRQLARLRNLQMNDDSFPPGCRRTRPRSTTAAPDPLVAVAAANDYVSGGVVVMRTADGGKSWKSTRVTPQFGGTRDGSGGDPAVAYSRRDHAFYLTQLCSSGRCRSPRSSSSSRSTTARPGPRPAGGASSHQLRLRQRHRR